MLIPFPQSSAGKMLFSQGNSLIPVLHLENLFLEKAKNIHIFQP
jgi:hypothetical protein